MITRLARQRTSQGGCSPGRGWWWWWQQNYDDDDVNYDDDDNEVGSSKNITGGLFTWLRMMMTHYDDDDFWCEVLLWFIVSDPSVPLIYIICPWYDMCPWYIIYHEHDMWYIIYHQHVELMWDIFPICPIYFQHISPKYLFNIYLQIEILIYHISPACWPDVRRLLLWFIISNSPPPQ